MDSVRVARKGWLIAGLSAVLPGLGHWYIGKRDKAIFVLSSFLFHMTLAYTLLHMVVIEQPVTVIYLLVVIPYHYFYAIFNSLQTRNDRFHYRSLFLLMLAIVPLLTATVLWFPIDALYSFKQQVSKYYPTMLLLSSAIYLFAHMRKRSNGKIYLGRISSALTLLLFLLLQLLQQSVPIQWNNWLLALPIILILEVVLILLYSYRRATTSGYSFDIWGLCVTSGLIISGYVVIQYSDYPAKLLESFHAPTVAESQLDSERGFHYELAPIKISPTEDYKQLQLRHLNGYVRISSGEVDEITIFPELYVNTEDEEQALAVKEQSSVDVSFDGKLSITTTLSSYQLNQYPRMNLRIIIPRQQRFLEELDVRVEHGAISVGHLVVSGQLKLDSNSSSIHVESTIAGTHISSKSGSIHLYKTAGDIDVQTKKGDITIIHPTRSISAISLNGNIDVRAKLQNDDWKLNATVGNIQLELPKQPNYHLSAKVSFGYISTPFLKTMQMKQALPDERALLDDQSLPSAPSQSDGRSIRSEHTLQDEQIKQLDMSFGAERYTIELYASHYILLE